MDDFYEEKGNPTPEENGGIVEEKAEEVIPGDNGTPEENITAGEESAPEEARPTPPYFNNIVRTAAEEAEEETQGATYGVPRVNEGRIVYAPADGQIPHYTEPAKKQKKKKGGKGWVAILVVACVLLSFGAGFMGAYVAGVTGSFKTGPADAPAGPVIKQAESPADGNKETSADGGTGFTAVVNAVADSVVEINTEFKSMGWFSYVSGGAGSGVIISEDGYIVTNNHVICKEDGETPVESVTVRSRSGEEYSAKIVGKDVAADIAVIKIEATGLTAAVFGDSDGLKVGDEVVAIGNPLGVLGGTVTNGIISALAREINVDGNQMTLLQTNAEINRGNSGGGLFNLKGELIGVVNAKSAEYNIEGLGFAIPSNDALECVNKIMKNAENGETDSSDNPIIGVTIYNVDTPYKAAEFGVRTLGVYLMEVREGYNDDVLREKDRIVEVNGAEVTSGEDIINAVRESEVGDKLTFTLYRDGKRMDVEVTCFASDGQ